MVRHLRPDDAPALRRNFAQAIGSDARAVARAGFVRAGFTDESMVLHWSDIVGPEVARLAHPVKLTKGESGGILTLSVEPAASVFLQHDARALCERINAFAGHLAVARLKLVLAGAMRAPRAHSREPHGDQDAPANDPAKRFEGPEGLKRALLGLAAARKVGSNIEPIERAAPVCQRRADDR